MLQELIVNIRALRKDLDDTRARMAVPADFCISIKFDDRHCQWRCIEKLARVSTLEFSGRHGTWPGQHSNHSRLHGRVGL